jgi:uncharacterized protein YjbI with pentapeptide repeats
MTKPTYNSLLYKKMFGFGVSIVILLSILGHLLNIQQENIGLLQKGTENIRSQSRQIKSIEERLRLEKDILVIEKDKTIIQNSFYNGIFTTILQSVGGAILFATAYIGYRNFKIAEDNLKISQDKHLTDRFSKAIEHLGSDKTDVRLGGIYTLEQIAVNSQKYHWTIVEILSAFIREKSPRYSYQLENNEDETLISFISSINLDDYGVNQSKKTSIHNEDDQPKTEIFAYNEPEIKKPTVDIIAAMVVLSRRTIEHESNLEKEILMDLRSVNLAEIEIAKAKLSNVNLGKAYLYRVYFEKANLSKAHLRQTYLKKANLKNANLSEANVSGANLSEASLEEANMSGANLSHANLSKARLEEANLSGANLRKADLSEACLKEANLSGANLRKANLSRTNLSGANLRKANLSRANLSGADLKNADLVGADLKNADLRNTDLRNTKLLGVDLKTANLVGAQIDKGIITEDTGDISGSTIGSTGYKNGLD